MTKTARMVLPSLAAAAAALATLGLAASAPAASNPSVDVRPVGTSSAHVDAMRSTTRNVHLNLNWNAVQPNSSVGYRWGAEDQRFLAFRNAGIAIRSVRVLNAPDWAIGPAGVSESCPSLTCPPHRDHYPDFRAFAREAAKRYGPGTHYDIGRFTLWNEPNNPKRWGGKTQGRGRGGDPREYSNLLVPFYRGVKEGHPGLAVDAGEIGAGGRAGDDGPGPWIKRFTAINTRLNRNHMYDILTIHPFVARPWQVSEKIRTHRRLPGVTRVVPTEWGWSVGNPHGATAKPWVCVASEQAQRQFFLRSLRFVRQRTSRVPYMVWFTGVDNYTHDAKVAECRNPFYEPEPVRREMNSFGLFRRMPDGSDASLSPRPVQVAFANQQR